MEMSNSSLALKWLKLDKDDKPDNFYSCLGAVIASTLLVLHLNVPPPHHRQAGSRSILKRIWESELACHLRLQLSWAVAIVIAPELLVSIAFGDWRAASQAHAVIRIFGRGEVASWGKMQASFANMGGMRFEITRTGIEIPGYIRRADARHSMIRLHKYMRTQQLPFNRALKKCVFWWHLVSKKVAVLMQTISRLAVTGSLLPYSVANGVCTMAFKDITVAGKRSTHIIHCLVLYLLLGMYVLGRLFMLVGMTREFFA